MVYQYRWRQMLRSVGVSGLWAPGPNILSVFECYSHT